MAIAAKSAAVRRHDELGLDTSAFPVLSTELLESMGSVDPVGRLVKWHADHSRIQRQHKKGRDLSAPTFHVSAVAPRSNFLELALDGFLAFGRAFARAGAVAVLGTGTVSGATRRSLVSRGPDALERLGELARA